MRKKSSKKIFGVLLVFFLIVCLKSPVFAQVSSWTTSTIDSWNRTTYSLSAPYAVNPDPDTKFRFEIVATATDTVCPPYTNVGGAWSIQDNGNTIAQGILIQTNADGVWSYPLQYTIFGNTREHTISFTFRDMGYCGGGMSWDPFRVISGVTVLQIPNLPPSVEAGDNKTIDSEDQMVTTITGTASDPDGDALTYRWLDDDLVVLGTGTVNALGQAPLNLGDVSPLAIRDHTFSLLVSDGTSTVTDTVHVIIENSAPGCNIQEPYEGEHQYDELLTFIGQVSDYDQDALYFKWTLSGQSDPFYDGLVTSLPPGGGYTDVVSPSFTTEQLGLLAGNNYTLTFEVSEMNNPTQLCVVSRDINIVDTTAPVMNPVPSTSILWPPNGELTTVTIDANATDNTGGPVMLNAVVTSSEPSTDKDGNPDFAIINIDQATGVITSQLRAQRTGNGGDRLYQVTVEATDQSGNSSKGHVVIKAPHDNGRN